MTNYQLPLLLVWIAVGSSLRFTHLTAKSPWTDEFSTVVFSLGNSFQSVPLDRVITADALLQPLQANSEAGIADVIHHLLTESNHPPLYFVLAHLWMKVFIFPLASLVDGGTDKYMWFWAARSLPTLFGVASIPAVYGLSKIAFRSPVIAQLSAAMMAVSPYGIYLAQEARHYTLAILFVIASFCYLVVAARHIQHQKPLSLWMALTWTLINILGISTHYFFALTLCAEAMVLLVLTWHQRARLGDKEELTANNLIPLSPKTPIPNPQSLIPLIAVAASTLVGGLVWLPIWFNNYNNELTQWIYTDKRLGWAWISPVFQVIADWMTGICLLPVEASNPTVVIISAAVTDIFFLWTLPIFYRGLKAQLHHTLDTGLATQVLGGVVGSAIALFLVFTYVLSINLTWQARYHFVYFPAVIVLVGASLAVCWNGGQESEQHPFLWSGSNGKTSVALIWLIGLLSGITVVCNLGYQKYYRPDLFVPLIQQVAQVPVLIATTHKTHEQTGEMMGVAWELKRSGLSVNPQFILAHQDKNSKAPTATFQQTLNQLPRPFDLWLVNFHAPLRVYNCAAESQSLPAVKGYNYKLYHCL